MKSALVIILLWISLCAYAQTPIKVWDYKNCMQSEMPYFEIITTGLPSTNCNKIITDSNGYVWVGTKNGLGRYDGVHVQSFFVNKDKTQDGTAVQTIYEDTTQNTIWVSFSNLYEIGCIDLDTYETKTFDYSNADKETRKKLTATTASFGAFCNYNDSLLLGASNQGFCLINKKTHHIRGPYNISKRITATTNKFLTVNDTTYFAVNGALYVLDKSNPTTPAFKEVKSNINGKIRRIAQFSERMLCIFSGYQSTEYTVWLFDRYTNKAEALFQTQYSINDMICMHDGIWLSTSRGLKFYDYRTKELREYTTRNTIIMSNQSPSVTRSKHQPILWFATTDGIVKCDYMSSKFSITDLRRFSSSSTCNVFTLHKDRHNNYWMWCGDGLFLKRHGEDMFSTTDLIDEEYKKYAILSMNEDTILDCLYMTTSSAIIKIDLKRFKSTVVSKRNDKSYYKESVIGPGNKLCTWTKNGYYILDNDKQTFKKCIVDSERAITDFSFAGDSVLWLSNAIGNIYKLELDKDTAYFVTNISHSKTYINRIRHTYRNGMSELWVATQKGLYYYLPQYDRVNKIDYSALLLNKNIKNLEIDKANNVWAASSEGLVCINNNDGHTYEYTPSTHNISALFNVGASTVAHDGKTLMGGDYFFIEFDSENFSQNDYYPTPIISSYRFANSTTYSYDDLTTHEILNCGDTIDIPRGIRSLQLFVRTLNFNNSRSNMVFWRLPESNNPDWHLSPTTSPLLFDNITHGVQTLELRSCDNNGNPTKNSRFVYLNKHVYFYEHPAFSVLIILFAITLIILFFFFKNRINTRMRIKLEKEVDRQAGEIRLNNIALTKHKEIIDKQNRELQEQKNNLEIEVASRTADLKEAYARAEESSKLKSAFLANLSHEVRTPMNCIMGFSKLIAENLCTEEETQEYAHLIRESGNSLLVLINDLLDISRIESGQLRINFANFPIHQEITDTYNILQVERKNESVKFLLSNDDILKDRMLNSDKDRFRQIIINIVYNAFKFTQSGYVKITATTSEPKELQELYEYPKDLPLPNHKEVLMISIEDTGVGIPSDKLEVIFEPFRKLNAGKNSIYPGLGLGLNIVKNLVSHMGGEIWVTSEEGHGTTFYFYLPF